MNSSQLAAVADMSTSLEPNANAMNSPQLAAVADMSTILLLFMKSLQALRGSIAVMRESLSGYEVTFVPFTVKEQLISNDNEIPDSWSLVEVEYAPTNGISMRLGIIELIGVRSNFQAVDAKAKFIWRRFR